MAVPRRQIARFEAPDPYAGILSSISQSMQLIAYFKQLRDANKPTYQMMGDKLIKINKQTGEAEIVKDFMTQGANWSTVKGDFEGVANALLMNKGSDAFLDDKGKYDSSIAYGYLLNSDELKDVLNSPRQRPYVNQMKLMLRKKALDLPRASSEKAWTELDRFMKGNNVYKSIIDVNLMKRESLQKRLDKVNNLTLDKISLQYGGKTFDGQPIMPTAAWEADKQGYINEIEKLTYEPSFLDALYNYNSNLKSISTNLNDMFKNFKHINVDTKPIQDYLSASMTSGEIGIINEGITDLSEKFPDIRLSEKKDGDMDKLVKLEGTTDLKKLFPNLLDKVYFEKNGDEQREWNKFTNTLKRIGKGYLPDFQKDSQTKIHKGEFKDGKFIQGKDITYQPKTTQEFVTGKESIIDQPLMEFKLPPIKTSLDKTQNPLMNFNLDESTKQDSLNQIINILNK